MYTTKCKLMHFVILCDIYDTGTEMMPEVGEIIW